ncbi:hypothetical protein RhiJN_22767 [Ceratobasidium sp. AG-Ba]|nr:hypothetical protein RhiJN_22767 [Ceratobasidium sp. AG-Ba]
MRSEYDECVERINQLKASGESQFDWDEWVHQRHERQEEYLDQDRATQAEIWNQDFTSKAAEDRLMLDLELNLTPKHRAKWKFISSWQGYRFSEAVWASLLPLINNLRSASRHASERYALGILREMKLALEIIEPMRENQSELVRGLSGRFALAKLRTLLDWYPVPSLQDILVLPAVENWLRSNDLPRDTDAGSWTVEIPREVSQAIDLLCYEERHKIAEKVRIGRQRIGFERDPPRPRFARNRIYEIDPFENVTPDVSLLHQKDTVFYRGEEPGSDVWSMVDILIELEEQDETIPQTIALHEYKFHTKAWQILQYLLPALPNQDICFMEFETLVFRCYRCGACDMYGFAVVEHYLEAEERHERIVARLEAVEIETSSIYSFLHHVDVADATPLAVVIEKRDVPENHEDFEVVCLACEAAGVQDPIFKCKDANICMRMCRFHVREEHNIPHEKVDNYVQIVRAH